MSMLSSHFHPLKKAAGTAPPGQGVRRRGLSLTERGKSSIIRPEAPEKRELPPQPASMDFLNKEVLP